MLEQIIGHDHQKEQLRTLMKRETFPHAIIFSGEAGIGKRSCAIACATELFSKDDENLKEHTSLVQAGNHPDLHVAAREEGKKELSVETIRGLRDSLQLKPYMGRRVVALIDEAELMNASAYNAILKTLEEPGEATVLFLITSALHALPETIRSRCQVLHFSPLAAAELEALLIRLLPKLSKEAPIEHIREQLHGSLELLGLNQYCAANRIGLQDASAAQKQAKSTITSYLSLHKEIAAVIASGDTAKALSLASTVGAAKGNERMFFSALRSLLLQRVESTPSKASADTLLAAIRAEASWQTRNANPLILASEILLQAADLRA